MPAFYRLPVGLLTIIAQCVTEEKEWFKEGKALRLTHPHFANLDYLNAHLFHNIDFHATPEGIDRLKSRSWTAIESFIRKITFLPSEYSTDMTFYHYRNIVMEQCEYYWIIERNLTDHPIRYGPELETDLDSKRWKEPSYAPGELFASFREYRRQALAAQAVLDDGSLQVWTDTIKQLPNVKTFEYGKLKKHSITCSNPGALPRPWDDLTAIGFKDLAMRNFFNDLSSVPPLPHLRKGILCQHSPGEQYRRIHRDRSREPSDGVIFGLKYRDLAAFYAIRTQVGLIEPVSACINAAYAQPEKLLLLSTLAPFATNSPLPPDLRSLDLSRLRSLEWRTELFDDGSEFPSSGQERNRLIMALLRKCHLSIQDLRIIPETDHNGLDHDREVLWPPAEAKFLPLPNLRRLHLTGSMAPRTLAPWIASMPLLETLSLLQGAEFDGPGCWNWRLVLDAIREHPSLLHVQFKIACEMFRDKFFVADLSVFTRNSRQTKRAFQVGVGNGQIMKEELKDEGDSLCRWLEGDKCVWDPRLDQFFPLRFF